MAITPLRAALVAGILASLLPAGMASTLEEAEQSLQARDFAKAAEQLQEHSADDRGSYLRAVAFFLDGKFAESEATAIAYLEKFADSKWRHKARFLHARACIEQGKHKEAEAIFATEADRIFSNERKLRIAETLIAFADRLSKEPAPGELDALPADHGRALQLYRQVLGLEITRDQRDAIQFKVGEAHAKLNQHPQAINAFRAYLDEFDPTWAGAVGTDARKRGQLKENPKPAGKRRLEARAALVDALYHAKDFPAAKQNAEDLLVLLAKERPNDGEFAARVRLRRLNAYDKSGKPDKQIANRREFLEKHSAHAMAPAISNGIAPIYYRNGRPEEAVAAHEDFIGGKNYRFAATEKTTTPDAKTGVSPAEQVEKWKQAAAFQIGQIRFNQRNYEAAVDAWRRYVAQFPNGAEWAASQSGIVNAEFQMALDAVSEEEGDLSRQRFDAFLKKYPLDGRSRQILFTLGQLHVTAAQDEEDIPERHKHLRRAIDEWSRLISKYPNTEEASLALYQTAVLQTEDLGEMEDGLANFKRLTWGSWANPAKSRVTLLSEKSLGVATERTFRTNEEAQIAVTVRNIEKLKVSVFPLNLESYFRKTHELGRIDHLDIDLIQPEKTFEVAMEGYKKFHRSEQKIPIPFEGNEAGIRVVKVEGGDWSATTLVVRSDIELIMKSSRRELLVYVQDQLRGAPAAGAELLLSDGTKIIGTGVTGDDGVFRGRFDELKTGASIRVLASTPQGVATNLLDIANLQFSSGLTARGYIYSDKSAYRPGEQVALRGILRDVKEGSYIVPDQREWTVKVSDPSGRLMAQSKVTLSDFGGFDTGFKLPGSARVGDYVVVALDEKSKTQWANTFRVAEFKVDRMRLKFDFPQRVYFRGETVTGTLTASYYWGSPAADQAIHYVFPDGRVFTEKTDAEGRLAFEFDTSGFQAGSALAFQASVPALNITQKSVLQLSQLGFGVSVRPQQPLALSGEPFEVVLKTTGADGKPVGKEISLAVLRRDAPKSNRTLEAVPWISHAAPAAAEITVEEHKITTDPKTGEGSITLKLEKGGRYTLRGTGQDRFDQTVIGASYLTISDGEDANKLRFFAEKNSWEVGAKIPLRLHSRVGAKLALLTYEGEEILSHKVISLNEGYNDIDAVVGHEHFPNFRVSVALIDGNQLLAATKRFHVKRELNVAIRPSKDVFVPGEEGEIEIEVTDQLGRPVEAEVSLALVNEALYSVHADGTTPIVSFFQQGASRYTEFMLRSTAGFLYPAQSRKILKQEANTEFEYVSYANPVEQMQTILSQELGLNRFNSQLAMSCSSNSISVFNNGSANVFFGFANGGNRSGSAQVSSQAIDGLIVNQTVNVSGFANSAPEIPQSFALAGGQLAGGVAVGYDSTPVSATESSAIQNAQYTSIWISPVVTDSSGKATVKLALPAEASEWRITARGATRETLVGQEAAKVITRKELFIDMRLPDELQEGDAMPVMATVHNLSEFEGEAIVKLTIEGGEAPFRSEKTIQIRRDSSTDVLFDKLTIPFSPALRLTAEVVAGAHADIQQRTLQVRPYGLEYASMSGGVTGDSADAHLELPEGQNYKNRQLLVTLSPSMEQAIVDLALGRATSLTSVGGGQVSCLIWPEAQTPPSTLLAAASALEYARARNAATEDIEALAKRVREYAAIVVTSQKEDGSWGWNDIDKDSNLLSVATAYWGLVLADRAGVEVHPATLAGAEKHLRGNLSKLDANDSEGKAFVVHALSLTGNADFSVANRLYRDRSNLSATALGYLSASFVHMKRDGFARDLLAILKEKAIVKANGVAHAWWAADAKRQFLSDSAETTGLILWTLARVDRQSPLADAAAQYLLTQASRLQSTRSLGAAIAGLSEFYREGDRNADDFEVTVVVNDKAVLTTTSKELRRTEHFAVSPARLVAGENSVRVDVKGRGDVRYAATLTGYSQEMHDPKNVEKIDFKDRRYFHDKLAYRDVPLAALSESPVQQLTMGQRFRATIRAKTYDHQNYFVWEEHIPAGALYVEGSLKGNFDRVEHSGSKMMLYFRPGTLGNVGYEMVAHAPGDFRLLPTVIRDASDRGRMRVGAAGRLQILRPGQESPDPYVMNRREHYELATKLFNDGRLDDALKHIDVLFNDPAHRKHYERDLARMLLWIHTARETIDAARIVEAFEILRERHPDLVIPFDRTLVVGKAYRAIGEFERAWLVFRAAIQSSFLNDAKISAVLEDQGQFLGSVKYQEDLWFEYPDNTNVVMALFGLSQSLFQKAPEAKAIAARERQLREKRETVEEIHAAPGERDEPEKVAMLKESARLLDQFLTLYPTDPLVDDAAFSEVNVFFAVKDYAKVVERAELSIARHEKSAFRSSFEYMAALGHFWQRHYEDALKSAESVAGGASKDRDYARYITAQIYHATGKPGEAMEWYGKVRDLYPDAAEAIAYFEEKKIGIKEVSTFKPGEPIDLELDYRNIKEAALQVYKVDLLKLYLREKNLSDVAKVDLAGIDPEVELTVPLGDGNDFANMTKTAKLSLKDEGAYLVICRGDNLFTSGLVLITPLKLEIQEDASGSVRVNVRSTVSEGYVSEVLVKVVGTQNNVFFSGHTDLRGIFEADGVQGSATVLAKAGESQYAFYRGVAALGKPVQPEQNEAKVPLKFKGKSQLDKSDYLKNIEISNDAVIELNFKNWDTLRRGDNGGVEVQQAR